MNDTLPTSCYETLHWESKVPFKLTVAYEDDIMHSRTVALYDELQSNLCDDYNIQFSWWKFQFLYDPVLLARAVTAAIEAHMIIIAFREGKEPPWVARRWIDKWLERKEGHDCALVALVEGGPSGRREDCPVIGYLSNVADVAQMNFFPHVFAATPSIFINPLASISARETIVKPLVEDLLRSPTNVPLWGINEY